MANYISRPTLALLSESASWPLAKCPNCGHERRHPIGGAQTCDRCREENEIAEAAEVSSEELAALVEQRRERLPQLLAKAGCPKRYQSYTRASWEEIYGPWTGPKAGEVTPRLEGWTGESPETWLVLFYGAYGQRKTSLATALLGERLVAGKQCVWLDTAEWVRDMKAAFGVERGEGTTTEQIYERARDAEVLLCDDIGAVIGARSGNRGDQTWWKEEFSRLMRHREMWVKPTIGTANIRSVGELAEIDRSLVSRMDVDLAFEFRENKDYRIRA